MKENLLKKRNIIYKKTNKTFFFCNEFSPSKDTSKLKNKNDIMNLFIKDYCKNKYCDFTKLNKRILLIKTGIRKIFYVFDDATYDYGGTNNKIKISIDYNYNQLKNFLYSFDDETDAVIFINIFFIWEQKNNSYIIDKNYIWIFVSPKEFIFENLINKMNPSSRWITVDLILSLLNSNNYSIKNKKGNVFASKKEGIHKILTNEFFNNEIFYLNKELIKLKEKQVNEQIELFIKRYKKINKTILENDKDKLTIKVNNDFDNLIKNIRIYFRKQLIKKNNQLTNSNITNNKLLVASHIWSIKEIKNSNLSFEEKIKHITNINNGIFVPHYFDKIFDSYFISMDNNLNLLVPKKFNKNFLNELLNNISYEKPIIQNITNEKEFFFYLEKHREKTIKENGELIKWKEK